MILQNTSKGEFPWPFWMKFMEGERFLEAKESIPCSKAGVETHPEQVHLYFNTKFWREPVFQTESPC